MTHLFFDTEAEIFTENDAPDWLTGVKTIKGSTMDCRWFWNDYILKLEVGQSRETDFQIITRIK
jgi:hypothetical protein